MRPIKLPEIERVADFDRFDGLKVAVAEDDWLVSMALQEMLSEMGCSVVGAASEVDEAMLLARQDHVDVAVLDYWLHDKAVDRVADALIANGVPVVLATGFGAQDIAQRFRHLPLLTKPYVVQDVVHVLAQIGAVPAACTAGRRASRAGSDCGAC